MNKSSFSKEQWLNPDKKFRSAPFWSWNGKLNKDELVRQIRIFKEMGMGGFFMHSRIGLATEYLSKDWFDMIHGCIDEAEKLDMDAWLYDEDRWPSGYAGGKVTENPEYRLHLIFLTEVSFEQCADFIVDKQAVALFAAVVDGVNAEKVRKISSPAEVGEGETLLQFVFCADFDNSWYNNCSYLNPMNREAVQKFIDFTHEKYLEECGNEFGRRVPGIFTDEPQYGFVVYQRDWVKETQYSTPFDMQIREIIKKRYNYDIIDRIYELFFDVKECEFHVSRLHYIKIMTELFLENYGKTIGDWCKKHNLSYTGHVMGEDFMSRQTWNSGSPMRYYRYMDMPGIDMLSDTSSNYFIARELSSAGRQFGQRDRLAELYGCTGWDFPPAGHKAIGDWLMALGVNFRCQHLAHYTMAGEGKRDYPASIRDHLTWYKEHKIVEDYFARINTVLSSCDEKCDILLLSPNESAWCMIHKNYMTDRRVYELDEKFASLNMDLQCRTLDFDIGDEGILETDAEVSEGMLKVGLMSYKAVVVPAMLTMRESTYKLLADFKGQGGIVIFADAAPQYIDGIADKRAVELADKCAGTNIDILEKFRRVKVSVNSGEMLVQSRYGEKFDALFVVNASCVPHATAKTPGWIVPKVVERKTSFDSVEIEWFAEKGTYLYELDPENGKIYFADAEQKDGKWIIHTSFSALQSRLFVSSCEKMAAEKRKDTAEQIEYAELPQSFEYNAEHENILVIDHFDCKLDGINFAEDTKYVLQLDDAIRKELDIPVRGAYMVQPWVETPFCGKTGNIELTAEFKCEYLPQGEVFLALETPECFKIVLNDVEISSENDSFFFDHSLRKIVLPENILRKGANKLVLQLKYDCRFQGLEAMYLGGNFGVAQDGVNGKIVELPQMLCRASWTEQGFLFYHGNITYKCRIQRNTDNVFMLKLPDFKGACCKIRCNGKDVKVCLWESYEADLSDFVQCGSEALLELEVVGSPRNMMGPFFYNAEKINMCHPFHFKEYGSPVRKLIPLGIIK